MLLRRLAFVLLAGSLAMPACSNEFQPLVVKRCEDDIECANGLICEDGACVPKGTVSCQEIEGGAAILQPGPPVVDFGKVGPATSFQTLVLRNIGNCTLTIFDIIPEGGDADAFECARCADDLFPIELFPLREAEIEVSFTPEAAGAFATELRLLSDDAESPDTRVPVRARFDGEPDAKVRPDAIEFSFLQRGRTVTELVQVSNHGTGVAQLMVTDVRIEPDTAHFSVDMDEVAALPVAIDPISVDPRSVLGMHVNYHPKSNEDHTAELVVVTNQFRGGTFRVPLTGTALSPPKVVFSDERIELGTVPLGETEFATLTILNEGGSPLMMTYQWRGTSLNTDLSAVPRVVASVRPGSRTELQVFVTPTSIGEITGLLVFQTNDPRKPSISIPVAATGTDVPALEVLKIEMAYDNSDSGFFGDDLRNVDMTLENPLGQICNKQYAAPMDWGGYGAPQWFAFGATEEPERIILPAAMLDGEYRVSLQYAEDCASVPTNLVASVLGISISALVSYYSGGAVNLDAQQLAEVISMLCIDHDSTQASVAVWVNGSVIGERTVPLGRKGDFVYAFDIIRERGSFILQ